MKDKEVTKNDVNRMNRRTFLKIAGTTAGAISLGVVLSKFPIPSAAASVQIPQVPLAGGAIPKYVDPLLLPARIDATAPCTVLEITMSEFEQQVLPSDFVAGPYSGKTLVWGYNCSFPGPTIVAQRNVPLRVKWVNNLVNPYLQKLLTVDQTLHWADPLGTTHNNMCMMHPVPLPSACGQPYTGPVPTVVHLHGGEVEAPSDGHPEAWFTPCLEYKGPTFRKTKFIYHNRQEATTLWYHDHALGTTRLNVYAGLAGFYFLRDWWDATNNPNGTERPDLPGGPLDSDPKYEVEIVIQDRMFDTDGQLFFPDLGINPTVHPYWIPEFFGDVIVVNGKAWPYLIVDPRRYRFRFLNGSNARFYRLSLGPKLPFWVIGTDGGFLDKPVMVKELFIAPGERADVIVDFAPIAGTNIIMTNSAKAPFPDGTAPDPRTVGQIMQFRVGPAPVPPVTDPSYDPATGVPLRTSMVRLASAGALVPGVTPNKTRLLTLNEVMGPLGPLEILLNNTKWDGTMSPNAGGITEMPQVGSTEVWEIVNLTADAHPIHLHLVQFQLINRQAFNVSAYMKKYNSMFPAATFNNVAYPGGVYIPEYGPPLLYTDTFPLYRKFGGNPDITPYLQGPARPPDPEEIGWKDTFKMFPGEVTRIVVRWAPQDIAVGAVSPGTNRYRFDPTCEPGYVWHCHILDHEDNEMMRPYIVIS